MKSIRPWAFGAAIVVIAVVALGWVLGISPKLGEVAAGNEALAAVNAENAQHQADLITLQEQFENIDVLREQLDALQAGVPADVGLPDFIRQVNTLAAVSGVTIPKLTTSDAAAFTAPTSIGTMLDAEGNVVQLPAAPANLITVNIVISITGSWSGILKFSEGLQEGERLFLVTDLGLAPNPGGPTPEGEVAPPPSFKGEITGLAYVLPLTEAAPAS